MLGVGLSGFGVGQCSHDQVPSVLAAGAVATACGIQDSRMQLDANAACVAVRARVRLLKHVVHQQGARVAFRGPCWGPVAFLGKHDDACVAVYAGRPVCSWPLCWVA